MQLKNTFSFLFFLSLYFVQAQKLINPERLFLQKDYFYWSHENINGAIKKATITNYSYTFNEVDSTYTEYGVTDNEKDVFVDYNKVFEFDRNRKMIRIYELKKDDSLFLEEENVYDQKGKIVFNTNRTKRKKRSNGKDSVYIHLDSKKHIYTSNGNLKEVWRKSTYQDNYFIDSRYTYGKDKLLSKYESFNTNVRTSPHITCKGSTPDRDYVKLYTYDTKKRLKTITVYIFEYNFDEYNFKSISKRDFSAYKLYTTVNYEYSEKDLNVKTTQQYYDPYRNNAIETTTREYDAKNRLVKDMTTYKAGHGNGHIYEYHEENDVLYKTVMIYTEKRLGANILLKKIARITEKHNEGYKEQEFNNGKRTRILYYSKHGDEVSVQDLEFYTNRSFQYVYDEKGNWISRILLEEGIKKEKVVRELEYYSK